MNTTFHPKGWGYELWICNNEKYCGKKLFFAKGKRCSYHHHLVKDEVFFINNGKLLVFYSWSDCIQDRWLVTPPEFKYPWTCDGIISSEERIPPVLVKIMEPGDTLHILPGMRHQMYGMEDTEMFEFSTTHMEEDSIRLLKGD